MSRGIVSLLVIIAAIAILVVTGVWNVLQKSENAGQVSQPEGDGPPPEAIEPSQTSAIPTLIPLNIRVTTDKPSYHNGAPILVTIRNDLATVIYTPPSPTSCSVINVQRLAARQWLTEGLCSTEGTVSPVAIAPKSEIRGIVGTTAQSTSPPGPIIGGPVTPQVMDKDLRVLPTAVPWKPGDPIREVPQGVILAEVKGLPFSALEGGLNPGTYRIEFRFTVGSTLGLVQTVYSGEFTVIE